jgi:hypothetical protein
MLLETRAAGAMPRRQMHMRVRDARVSVMYILAHTVCTPTFTHAIFLLRRPRCVPLCVI